MRCATRWVRPGGSSFLGRSLVNSAIMLRIIVLPLFDKFLSISVSTFSLALAMEAFRRLAGSSLLDSCLRRAEITFYFSSFHQSPLAACIPAGTVIRRSVVFNPGCDHTLAGCGQGGRHSEIFSLDCAGAGCNRTEPSPPVTFGSPISRTTG